MSQSHKRGKMRRNEDNVMTYYTISDLRNRFETCPYYTEEERIYYQEKRLTEMIRKDFNGKKTYNERKCWQSEEPQIWGISYLSGKVVPYSEEVGDFVKTIKKHSGGRSLIIMNESYFENCYFAIEKEYWDKKLNTLKKDTRMNICKCITASGKIINEDELCQTIEQLLNDFLFSLNEKIISLNDFLKSKYSQFYSYTNFYKNSYVERCLEKPIELLNSLEMEKEFMKEGFKELSHKNPDKTIDNIIELLSEKNCSDEMKIELIVDRIYSQERYLIEKFKKIDEQFKTEKIKIYELESEIRTETERLIKSNKEIYPGSFIISVAKDNGLLSPSFGISN